MKNDDRIKINGVVECVQRDMFEVHLDTGQVVLCKLSGKMRENRIRVLLGDCVECEVSPYDLSKGRIIHRHKERRGVE